MEILTNEINVDYNYVHNYFDTYKFTVEYKKEKNETFHKLAFLINSVNYGNVYSLYREGNKFTVYFLVDKDNIITIDKVFDNKKLEYFYDNKLKISLDKVNNISDDIILNLLLSKLSLFNKDKQLVSCNGKIFDVIKCIKRQIITLEYSIKNNCLNSRVVTFTETRDTNDVCYKLIGDYVAKGKIQGKSYHIKGDIKNKNKVNFFSGLDYSKFKNSKIVRMQELVTYFNETYSKYINISFVKKDFKEIKFQSFSDKNKSCKNKCIEKIQGIGINLLDNVKDNIFLDKIKNNLILYNVPFQVFDKPDKSFLNINIIHNKDFYKNINGDKYMLSNVYPVQNITVENNMDDKLMKMRVEIAMLEAFRKYEIINNTLLSFKTNNVLLNNFCFGQTFKKDNEFLSCEVFFDGNKMMFDIKRYPNIYKDNQRYIRRKSSEELFFINVLDNYPLVDIRSLSEQYLNTLREIDIKKTLIPLLESIKPTLKNKSDYEYLIGIIKKFDIVSMSTLYKEIKKAENTKKIIREINTKLFYDNCEIFFKPLWRKGDNEYKIAYTNIKYYVDENRGLFYYSAGCKNINQNISNGYPIRNINIKLNDEELTDFFKLLDVDSIRYNQSIVEPFPYKYINEYLRMNKLINKEILK